MVIRVNRETGMIDERLAANSLRLQSACDRGGLNDGQGDRQIAGVLRNLAADRVRPLWRRRSRYGNTTVINCKDDRRGDVRHDAERENSRKAPEVATAKQIENTQNRTLGSCRKKLSQQRRH